MFLALQVSLAFLFPFSYVWIFFYKYKEASKRHPIYFAITLIQNICLSHDFGQKSECFNYKFAANSD